MHDPDFLAFTIKVPVPIRKKWRDAYGPRWGVVVARRTNADNLGERVYPWWRLEGYELRAAGKAFDAGWVVVEAWHHEPGGRDAGTVCKGFGKRRDVRWAWDHREHLTVSCPPLRRVRSWLRLRCEDCGQRFHWREAKFATGWDSPGTLHGPCQRVRGLTHQTTDLFKVITGTASETENWRVDRAVRLWLAKRSEVKPPERL